MRLEDRTIYFFSDMAEVPLVRALCAEEKKRKRSAVSREAMWFSSEQREPCDRVVLMPSVEPWHADRIAATYRGVVPIERYEADAPAAEPPGAAVPAPPSAAEHYDGEQLRRMSTKQLRDLAEAHGLNLQNPIRINIINAIIAAQDARS